VISGVLVPILALPTSPQVHFFASFLFGWTVLPILVVMALLGPYTDPLKPNKRALLSLKKFLSDFKQNPADADYGLIKHAAESVADMLDDYNYNISPSVLAQRISMNLLEKNESKESYVANMILSAIDPPKIGELISIVKHIPDVEEPQRRKRFGGLLEYLNYITVILASVFSVVAWFLGR